MISTCNLMHSHVREQFFYLLCHNDQTFVNTCHIWSSKSLVNNKLANSEEIIQLIGNFNWILHELCPLHTWSIDMCVNVCHWHSTFQVKCCWFESITFKLRDNLYNLRYTKHAHAHTFYWYKRQADRHNCANSILKKTKGLVCSQFVLISVVNILDGALPHKFISI